MLNTFAIFILSMFSLIIIGLPITYNIFKYKNDKLWTIFPFVGSTIIIVFLRILVLFNIPMKITSWPFLILFTIYFIYFSNKNKKNIKNFIPSKYYIISIILIFIIVAIPMFIVTAKHYRGYGWWDQYFYATQADFFKTTKFSELNELIKTKPYLGATWYYFEGFERLGRGILQGFFASLTNFGGEYTLGVTGFIGIILIYSATLFVALDSFMKKRNIYLGSFFACILPGVITTQLEGFLPVLLFTAFIIMLSKLIPIVIKSNSKIQAIILGLMLGAVLTILADGFYVLLGFAAITLVSLVLTMQLKKERIIQIIIIFMTTLIANFNVWSKFLDEISMPSSRVGLNPIYSFALTPKVLNWNFFGNTLSTYNDKIYLILTFSSCILLILGIFGSINLFLKKRNIENILLLVLVFMPLIFLSEKIELQYSFYKMLSFAFPIIVLGIFATIEIIMNTLKETWIPNLKIQSLFIKLLYIIIIFIFCLMTSTSIYRTYLVTYAKTTEFNYDEYRVNYYQEISSKEYLELYEKMSDLKNKNILFLNQDPVLSYWWSVYYAKNNNIFEFNDLNQNIYFHDLPKPHSGLPEKPYFERFDYRFIPNDVVILSPDNGSNLVADNNANDYAAILNYYDKNNSLNKGKKDNEYKTSKFNITTFGREDAEYVIIGGVFEDLKLIVDGVEKEVEIKEGKIHLFLEKGSHFLELSSSKEVIIKLNISIEKR